MDSGPGIPESQYERVFERFYRVGGDRQSVSSGCGLGLSIVRYIVELHKARIELGPSELETGLCISIRFPLRIKR
ncbi:Alkaline phosphatase synthesis sensor protein PhoR [compost metagenome]